jgi:hypothetical protein
MHGTGLELIDDTTDPLHSLVVELQPPSYTHAIVVRGTLRHSSLNAEGRRRIGVEFVDIGPFEERALAELIARLIYRYS